MLLLYVLVALLGIQPAALAVAVEHSSHKCTIIDAQHSSFSPHLIYKAKIAKQACEKSSKISTDFEKYCEHVYTAGLSCIPTNYITTELDAANMKTIVAMENARNPGLNLVYIEDRYPESLLLSIKKAESDMPKPSTVRFIFSPSSDMDHRALAEVKLTDAGTSIVIFDSTLAHDDSDMQLCVDMVSKSYKVSVVAPVIQKSNFDCIMYSLHFALKSFKTKFGKEINDKKDPVVFGKDQRDRIPAAFFKHSQTSKIPEHENQIVDKDGTQTLKERFEACRATRFVGSYKITSSVSIEGFRLQEIQRVADAYGKGVKGFDRSLEKLYAPYE